MDRPIKPQVEEVEDVVMWTDEQIEEHIAKGTKITPDSVYAYQLLRKYQQGLIKQGAKVR